MCFRKERWVSIFKGLYAGILAYIGLQLTHCHSPLVFHLSFYYLQHYHSETERRLSKATNKMKSGAGLDILNQAWIEAREEEGILYVMFSRLNNWSHLPSSLTYSIIPRRKARSWKRLVLERCRFKIQPCNQASQCKSLNGSARVCFIATGYE